MRNFIERFSFLTLGFLLACSENPEVVLNSNEAFDGITIIAPMDQERVIVFDNDGKIFKTIPTGRTPGVDVQLLDDGLFLGNFRANNATITLPGFGGYTKIFDQDGSVEWEYPLNTRDEISHHDVELLPNGNILLTVWERKTAEVAQNNGLNISVDVFVDYLLEIDPKTNARVWEWHAWDHLVQNTSADKLNFGVPNDNKGKIDFNYSIENATRTPNNLTHSNGLVYDELNDLIFLSSNRFSEVWVIDHSTTTSEAETSAGGNFGKGGDLVFRFGNPQAYDGTEERLFNRQHNPNFVSPESGYFSNLMVFVNRDAEEGSIVYELEIPDFNLEDGEIVNVKWQFDDSQLYSRAVSGAYRLPNGNTLICEGDFGLWEVSHDGTVVWQFEYKKEDSDDVVLWRGYKYAFDDPKVLALDL